MKLIEVWDRGCDGRMTPVFVGYYFIPDELMVIGWGPELDHWELRNRETKKINQYVYEKYGVPISMYDIEEVDREEWVDLYHTWVVERDRLLRLMDEMPL